MRHPLLSVLVVLGLTASACSGSGNETSAELAATSAPTTEAPATTTAVEEAETTTAPEPDTEAESADESETASGAGRFAETDIGLGWTRVDHEAAPGEEECQCSDGSPWNFYVNRGTSQKTVIFFEGGGACWSELTCDPNGALAGVYKQTVSDEREGYEGLDLDAIDGIFDRDNAENPFGEHTMVFVPYCTGDVHLGNAEVQYNDDLTIQHRGAINARTAVSWVVENLGDTTDLFVTGSSAGSIPAPLYAGILADELPEASVIAFGDASGAYPDVPERNEEISTIWGTPAMAPDWPEYEGVTPADSGFPQLTVRTANHNPDILIGRFDDGFDQVQVTFLGLSGLDNTDPIAFMDANEEWIESESREIASYRTGGNSHTILATARLYTEAVDGVRFVDWLAELVSGSLPEDVEYTP